MVKEIAQSHGTSSGYRHRTPLLFKLSSESVVTVSSPHGTPSFSPWRPYGTPSFRFWSPHGIPSFSHPAPCGTHRFRSRSRSRGGHSLQSVVFRPSVPLWNSQVLLRIQFWRQACLGWGDFGRFLGEQEVTPPCPSQFSGHSADRGGFEHHSRADGHLGGGCPSVQLRWQEELICNTPWFRNVRLQWKIISFSTLIAVKIGKFKLVYTGARVLHQFRWIHPQPVALCSATSNPRKSCAGSNPLSLPGERRWN